MHLDSVPYSPRDIVTNFRKLLDRMERYCTNLGFLVALQIVKPRDVTKQFRSLPHIPFQPNVPQLLPSAADERDCIKSGEEMKKRCGKRLAILVGACIC